MPAGPHSARRHREATCRDRSEGPRASACGCRGRGGGPECGSRVGPPASGGGSGVCPAWSGHGREAGRPPVSTRRAHAPVLFTLAMAPPSVPGSHLRLRPLFPIALHGPGAAAARPAGEQPERLAGERWRAGPRGVIIRPRRAPAAPAAFLTKQRCPRGCGVAAWGLPRLRPLRPPSRPPELTDAGPDCSGLHSPRDWPLGRFRGAGSFINNPAEV